MHHPERHAKAAFGFIGLNVIFLPHLHNGMVGSRGLSNIARCLSAEKMGNGSNCSKKCRPTRMFHIF